MRVRGMLFAPKFNSLRQIALADVLILNKMDLVDKDETGTLLEAIK